MIDITTAIGATLQNWLTEGVITYINSFIKMITTALLAVVISLLGFIVYKVRAINQKWEKRGIKYRKPYLFFGNMLQGFTEQKHIFELYEEICKEFPDEPILGFYDFSSPCLLVQDAEYVEKILIKDFVHFIDHGYEINEEKNPIDAQLFSMVGKRWRAFRYKLSPIFTSGKLKAMYESISNCGFELDNYLKKSNKKDINFKQTMTQFTIDVMGSSVFGIQPKALENPNSKFCQLASDMFTFGIRDTIKFIFMTVCPAISKQLGLSINKPEAVEYFSKILTDTFEYRKKNNIQRNDFIQLLVALKEKEKIEIQTWDPNDDYLKDSEVPEDHASFEINDNIVLAQAYSFLINGLDGIGITDTNVFYELALNPDVQDKVRNEIQQQIKIHNGLTYNALKNMLYLEKVIKETLRIHSIASHIFRICNKQYTFPNGFTVLKGETVRIPVTSIHRNPNYFPDPDVFKPERFDDTPKPGTYLPFGDGPRVCIAMRYALLIIKHGIAKVLANHKIKLSPKTKLPLTYKVNSLVIVTKNPILFDLEEIN